MSPLQSLREYEAFIYSLPKQFVAVVSSTLVVFQADDNFATVYGELYFADGYRLIVRERLNLIRQPLVLIGYGYEIWRNAEKLYWYDPQPHPHIPDLALNHPHHKHVPPDITQPHRSPWSKRSTELTPKSLLSPTCLS